MASNRKKKVTAGDDEVEELLKAAEDEVFLKLNLNSHMSRVAPSYLQSDLDHRFQSLKKPNKSTPNPNLTQSAKKNSTIAQSDQMTVDDDDDLFTRFAKLKGTLPSSSSNSVNPNRSDRDVIIDGDDVDKIIQWAIDAARLDPSPPTDDDEADVDDDEDDLDDETDDDDDDGRMKNHKKSNPKKRK